MSEREKKLAKRIIDYFVAVGVLDVHFKAVIQTEESWNRALIAALNHAEAEEIKEQMERLKHP